MEAGAAGVPAVVPSAGRAAEIVLDGLTGLTYDPDDMDEFAQRIAQVIEWYARTLDQVGRAVRARAFALYTDDRCAAEYVGMCPENRLRYSQVRWGCRRRRPRRDGCPARSRNPRRTRERALSGGRALNATDP
ncbi:MAG: glycosyltransferase [Pseudonocardia sp.]